MQYLTGVIARYEVADFYVSVLSASWEPYDFALFLPIFLGRKQRRETRG